MIAVSENTKGFTLIELMIVVAIIGILAAIAVPNFIAYRNKSHIASGVATAGSIRDALGGFASTENSNCYPMTSDLTTWAALRTLCSTHGATLYPTLGQQGFSFFIYYGVDESGTLSGCDNTAGNECYDYCIVFRISGAPKDLTGAQIELRSSGISRQTY